MGIPINNTNGANFVESGILPNGSSFITRSAPGVGQSIGGSMEVVVPENSVILKTFTILD